MFFIPLNQIESVDLVIHALRAAGGEADCSVCPVRRVCMKQCLSIAEAVTQMVEEGTLPMIEAGPAAAGEDSGEPEGAGGQAAPPIDSERGHLKIIK